MTPSPVFVGIDVAKKRLDVAVRPSGEVFQVANDATGLHHLAQRLHLLQPRLIVLEASGGYERMALASLRQEDLPAERVNPVRCGISLEPWASWPRPTGWMP